MLFWKSPSRRNSRAIGYALQPLFPACTALTMAGRPGFRPYRQKRQSPSSPPLFLPNSGVIIGSSPAWREAFCARGRGGWRAELGRGGASTAAAAGPCPSSSRRPSPRTALCSQAPPKMGSSVPTTAESRGLRRTSGCLIEMYCAWCCRPNSNAMTPFSSVLKAASTGARTVGGPGAGLDFPVEAGPVLDLAISPDFAVDCLLYAGTDASGLLASADRGDSWAQVQAGMLSSATGRVSPGGWAASGDQCDCFVARLSPPAGHSGRGARGVVRLARPGPLLVCPRRRTAGVLTLAAPYGFSDRSPLLVGLAEGGVQWVD